jgi:hypothetical protein
VVRIFSAWPAQYGSRSMKLACSDRRTISISRPALLSRTTIVVAAGRGTIAAAAAGSRIFIAGFGVS